MKLCNLLEACQILNKYAASDQMCIAAEHDELYIGDDEWPISDEDRARLEVLGFHATDGMGWHAFT